MAEWIKSFMESLGYLGIGLLMFLENIFPPIPSELIMPLAGFTAAQGRLSFWGAVAAGIVGSVLGQLPLYYLGRLAGEEQLKRWADRYGKWLTVSHEEIERAKGWFDHHGGKAVFLCRLIPGIRSLISIPAGMAKMHLLAFLLYWGDFIAPILYIRTDTWKTAPVALNLLEQLSRAEWAVLMAGAVLVTLVPVGLFVGVQFALRRTAL